MGRQRIRSVAIGIAVLGLLLLIISTNFRAFDISGEKVYVATTGNDGNDGTIDRPYLTLVKAKARARQIKAANSSIPITVYLRAGEYFMATPLDLSASDSGSAGAPITYASYPKETAVITGAKTISGFAPITDQAVLNRLTPSSRANARVVNLPSLGISDYGSLKRRGGSLATQTSALELSFNNERMTLARYPNVGSWDTIASTAETEPTANFIYTDARPASWPSFNDIWVHGYFKYDWDDSHLKIASLNPTTKTVTIEGGFDSYGAAANQWFYYENVLDELDSPGEYYLDRSSGNLFFWPPSDPNSARVTVSLADKLITASSVSYVNFDRLTFEGTRATAFYSTESTNLKFTDNTFQKIGNDGVWLNKVDSTTLANNTFREIAERAVYIYGGDSASLAPSNDVIINNTVHDTAQWVRTARPGIEAKGVAIRIAHNEIYNLPQDAIRYSGNDHIIEYNRLHDVVAESLDAGAIFGGRSYTDRGTVIRYNSFKGVGGFQGKSANSLYWDDALSGQTAYGNLFDGPSRALLLGGGRDNVFRNNVMVNSETMIFDSRGFASPSLAEWMSHLYYKKITDASNTTPIVVTMDVLFGSSVLTAPKTIKVIGVGGNLAANGTWSYTVVAPNKLELIGSTGNGQYTPDTGDVISVEDFYTQLNAVNRGIYGKYPDIFNYTKYTLGEPVRNVFDRNIIYFGSQPPAPWISMYPSTPPYLNFTNGIIHGSNNTPAIPLGNSSADPQFVSPSSGDFRLKPTSPALVLGFTELPYEWIGRVTADQLLSALPDRTVKAGERLEVAAVSPYFSSDQAKNPRFSATSLPTGAVFNPATKTLSWTPTVNQVGGYTVTINAEDDYLFADRSLKITVGPGDRTSGGGGIDAKRGNSGSSINRDRSDGNSGGGGTVGQSNPSPSSNPPSDFVLPPVEKTLAPNPDISGPAETLKESVTEAVRETIMAPIPNQDTPRWLSLLTGFLLVIVLPLTLAVSVVVLYRRFRT